MQTVDLFKLLILQGIKKLNFRYQKFTQFGCKKIARMVIDKKDYKSIVIYKYLLKISVVNYIYFHFLERHLFVI